MRFEKCNASVVGGQKMSLRAVCGKTGVTTNPPVSPFRKGGAESPLSKGGYGGICANFNLLVRSSCRDEVIVARQFIAGKVIT
jgi:hypothetical protein